MKRW